MASKLKIAIACAGVCNGKGGSERVAVNLAAAMLTRGHAVDLLTWIGPTGNREPVYPLASGVGFYAFPYTGASSEITSVRERLKAGEYDCLLSLQTDHAHLYWLTACQGMGIPVICSERNEPSAIEQIYWNRSGRLAALGAADRIHEMLPAYVDSIPPWLAERVRVIPNAAPAVSAIAKSTDTGRKTLLYLGRLAAQKRPLILIEAFNQLSGCFPDWDLVIWGHGKLEQDVKKGISASSARERIKFMGQSDDPAGVYATAQIYCLPSSHEGFPNTALEAMAAGLPIVGFGKCAALANIIKQGETGILAKDETAASLAEALAQLMSDAGKRKRMGASAKREAEKYAPDLIYDQWEELFYETARLKGATVMNEMAGPDISYRADLSEAARREFILRNFGEPFPRSFAWAGRRCRNVLAKIGAWRVA